MAQRDVLAESALLVLTAAAGGTFTSGPIATSGLASDIVLLVHCTAITGTSPTLNVSLESSPDGTTWTAITGSGVPQVSAAGNAMANARANAPYVRVTATVAGTTPAVTARAVAMYF